MSLTLPCQPGKPSAALRCGRASSPRRLPLAHLHGPARRDPKPSLDAARHNGQRLRLAVLSACPERVEGMKKRAELKFLNSRATAA